MLKGEFAVALVPTSQLSRTWGIRRIIEIKIKNDFSA
jgi:hypothetical protein